MKQWLHELRTSWQDTNFICAITGFFLAYLIIAGLGMLLPVKVFIAVLAAIAGWQVASWSWQLAPKLKEVLQRLKIFS